MPIPFDEKELEVVAEIPGFGGTVTPVYNTPVTPREAYKSMFLKHEPVWLPLGGETRLFCPEMWPDNVARGFVLQGTPVDPATYGGKDMFGIDWVFVPQVNGSMVKPGSPTLEDVNDWKEVIKFPDIDSWDWEGSHEVAKPYLNSDCCNVIWFLNGCWFERLISFMDFEGAAMAVIDEDQVDAVKELVHATTDLYLRLIDKCAEHYPEIDSVCVHDDWGSQGAPFFSETVAREIFLPEMKRFVDHVHSKGWICDLHSCGHVEDRCSVFVDAGFDSWTPMPMNDTVALFDKYGDKIAIGVVNPFHFDPATATEEEQRECARKFAERFCKPGFRATWSNYNNRAEMTPAFREELYKQSRIAYSK